MSSNDIDIIDNTYDQFIFMNITDKLKEYTNHKNEIYKENAICEKGLIRFSLKNVEEFKDVLINNYQKIHKLASEIKNISDQTFDYEVPESIIDTSIKRKTTKATSKKSEKSETEKGKQKSLIETVVDKPHITIYADPKLNISDNTFDKTLTVKVDINITDISSKKPLLISKISKIDVIFNIRNGLVKIIYIKNVLEVNHYYFTKYLIDPVQGIIQFNSVPIVEKIAEVQKKGDILGEEITKKFVHSILIKSIYNKELFNEISNYIKTYNIKSF